MEEFRRLGLQVLIIGFEGEEKSEAWLADAGVSLPFLMDTERTVYRAFELKRSIARTYHPRTVWFYLRRLLQGKGLPKPEADRNQLGGDFIIDRDGFITLAYYSADPTDRPDTELLQAASVDI